MPPNSSRIAIVSRHNVGKVLWAVTLAAWGAGYSADPMHVASTSAIRRRLLAPTEAAHGDEVTARHGERWLALLRTESGYRTEMVNLKVKPVADPLAGDPSDRSAKHVGIQQPGSLVFLLNGYAHLSGRSVPTSIDGNFRLVPYAPTTLHSAGRKVELELIPNGKVDKAPGGEPVTLFQVNIKNGAEWVPLPLVATENENQVELLWAGDLDGDGKIDLLFQDHGYNWSSIRLFLSTAAKSGQIVAEVAQFYQTGC